MNYHYIAVPVNDKSTYLSAEFTLSLSGLTLEIYTRD